LDRIGVLWLNLSSPQTMLLRRVRALRNFRGKPYMGEEVSLVSALFFKNHVGEEYVGRYLFMGDRKNGFFSAGPLFVTREDWSSKSFNLLKAR
jgi:hypothetical protein